MKHPPEHDKTVELIYRANSCPYLFHGDRCAGGNYCHFPEGDNRLCCFFCGRFGSCPDREGICVRLKDMGEPDG